MVRTRNAILPDVEQIHAIIHAFSGNGTLLPRTLAELRENVRDFVVAEDNGKIVGCGALHLYGMHLAEIRSSPSRLEPRGWAQDANWWKHCSRKPSGMRSLASACLRASRNFFPHGI